MQGQALNTLRDSHRSDRPKSVILLCKRPEEAPRISRKNHSLRTLRSTMNSFVSIGDRANAEIPGPTPISLRKASKPRPGLMVEPSRSPSSSLRPRSHDSVLSPAFAHQLLLCGEKNFGNEDQIAKVREQVRRSIPSLRSPAKDSSMCDTVP